MCNVATAIKGKNFLFKSIYFSIIFFSHRIYIRVDGPGLWHPGHHRHHAALHHLREEDWISTLLLYKKCNFPMGSHVRPSVGWSVVREVALPCFYRNTCYFAWNYLLFGQIRIKLSSLYCGQQHSCAKKTFRKLYLIEFEKL